VAGCGGHGARFAFARADGWHTAATGPHAQAASARASTIPFAESEAFPMTTIARLPEDGIVITAYLQPHARYGRDFPSRSLPLRLGDARVSAGWEGQPNGNAPQYRIMDRLKTRDLEVDVFFGTQHPSAGLRAKAQSELERLHVPVA
jgi:hypothetical protein